MSRIFTKKAICANCKHSLCNSPGSNIWYNWFCKKSQRVASVDPVTGVAGFSGKNDLGDSYVSDQKYDFCRDVNRGSCVMFGEAK